MSPIELVEAVLAAGGELAVNGDRSRSVRQKSITDFAL
jgi:hypothetical protein